jgi:hypothetical protein
MTWLTQAVKIRDAIRAELKTLFAPRPAERDTAAIRAESVDYLENWDV